MLRSAWDAVAARRRALRTRFRRVRPIRSTPTSAWIAALAKRAVRTVRFRPNDRVRRRDPVASAVPLCDVSRPGGAGGARQRGARGLPRAFPLRWTSHRRIGGGGSAVWHKRRGGELLCGRRHLGRHAHGGVSGDVRRADPRPYRRARFSGRASRQDRWAQGRRGGSCRIPGERRVGRLPPLPASVGRVGPVRPQPLPLPRAPRHSSAGPDSYRRDIPLHRAHFGRRRARSALFRRGGARFPVFEHALRGRIGRRRARARPQLRGQPNSIFRAP